jgi:hypothetical protein
LRRNVVNERGKKKGKTSEREIKSTKAGNRHETMFSGVLNLASVQNVGMCLVRT